MERGISFDLWGQALITSVHMIIRFCAFEYFSVYHHVFYNCIPSFHILFCLYLCAWAVLFLLPMICCSVAQSCLTLCKPMDCRMPGFPVLHHLLKLAQTHVHWVSDAIQPSHPLSSPSPPAFNLSQHQGLFQWVGSSHQVAKLLELQHQHQSFQRIFRADFF